MTQFDLIAGLIILASVAVGFVRGATRELVTALSFILAAALSPPLTVKDKGVKVTSVNRLTEAVERISQNRY